MEQCSCVREEIAAELRASVRSTRAALVYKEQRICLRAEEAGELRLYERRSGASRV